MNIQRKFRWPRKKTVVEQPIIRDLRMAKIETVAAETIVPAEEFSFFDGSLVKEHLCGKLANEVMSRGLVSFDEKYDPEFNAKRIRVKIDVVPHTLW